MVAIAGEAGYQTGKDQHLSTDFEDFDTTKGKFYGGGRPARWAYRRRVDEREAMTRALDLAWRGWGRVQPNPLVGAVVLNDGDAVGEGWHAEFGVGARGGGGAGRGGRCGARRRRSS